MKMTDHLRNAGQSLQQRTTSSARSASAGQLRDATESAWEGVVEATQEVGRSIRKNAGNLVQGRKQDQ